MFKKSVYLPVFIWAVPFFLLFRYLPFQLKAILDVTEQSSRIAYFVYVDFREFVSALFLLFFNVIFSAYIWQNVKTRNLILFVPTIFLVNPIIKEVQILLNTQNMLHPSEFSSTWASEIEYLESTGYIYFTFLIVGVLTIIFVKAESDRRKSMQ